MAKETSLGGISWYVDADTSSATDSIGEMAKQVQATEVKLKGLDGTVKNSSVAIAKLDRIIVNYTATVRKNGSTVSANGIVLDKYGAINERATKRLTQLKVAMESLRSPLDKASKTAKGVNSALTSMSKRAGMASIQFQQFIGQIQGGQSVMVASSQQLADLGFVLGAPLVGAVAGITASLAGMLLPALFETGKQTEELTDKIKELVKASTLSEAQSAFLVDQTNDEIEANSKLIAESENRIQSIKDQIADNEKLSQSIYNKNKLSKEEVASQKIINAGIADLRGELTKETAARDTLNNSVDDLITKRAAYTLATKKSLDEQDNEKKGVLKLKTALERLDEQLGTQVATLAMSDRGVAHYKASLLGATESMHAQIDAIYDHKDALEFEKEALKANTDEEKRRLAKMKEVAEWQASRRTEASDYSTDITGRGDTDTRAAEQEQLAAYYEQGLLAEQEYQDALTQIQKEGDAAREASLKLTLGTMSGAFSDLASVVADAEGEQSSAYAAMFAVSKAFAVAQAGLNLSSAVMSALADPTALTTAAKFANYATVFAAGTSLLSTISSASYSGRETGGSVLSGNTYEVGEKNKPELLMIPGNNGKVLSNSEMKGLSGGSGGFSQTINNHAASDGWQVRTRGDGMTSRQVVDIISTQLGDPNSRGRRNLSKGTSIQNKVGGNRR